MTPEEQWVVLRHISGVAMAVLGATMILASKNPPLGFVFFLWGMWQSDMLGD